MITIRRMAAQDIPDAVRIEEICFSEPWSEEVYRATLLLPYAFYYVAETEGDGSGQRQIIGTCGFKAIAGEGEISNVAVLPAYRRKGAAHQMLERVLEDAAAMNIEDVSLEVREGNTAARSVYESFGFQTEGIRKNFYARPVENALIMWRRRKDL